MRSEVCLILAAVLAAGAAAAAHDGQRVLINLDKDGMAVQGYDVVAYFTEGKPVKGDPSYRTRHDGAIFQFATKANLDRFLAEPARYEPQFGGYCGYAVSVNRLSPINPEFFQVLDGRLVLQHNQRALDKWNEDLPGNLVKADSNWPGLVDKNGTAPSGKRLVNLDAEGVAIQGYDPLAYFDGGIPAKGDPSIEAVYDGARYHFVSEQHREAFERDPTRYVPAYGGYCGYAASVNKVSPIDPAIFQLLPDGRLVLQHTRKAYDLFNKDTQRSVVKADRNWPGLVERKGK